MLKTLFSGALFLLLASAAIAQIPSAPVAQIFVNKPWQGSQQAYEQGRIKHMLWHKGQKDKWAWYTWEVMTGENTGAYIIGTFDHDWNDFDGRDQFEAADAKDAALNIGPAEASSSSSFYIRRPELSVSSEAAPTGTPAPYVQVIHFMLKPEAVNDFIEAVKKVGQGIKKTNAPTTASRWYSLASGGQGPEFVLVSDRKTYADFHLSDKTLDQIMQEAYGEEGAAILKTLRQSYYHTYSELLHYRRDLSYVPESAGASR